MSLVQGQWLEGNLRSAIGHFQQGSELQRESLGYANECCRTVCESMTFLRQIGVPRKVQEHTVSGRICLLSGEGKDGDAVGVLHATLQTWA